MDQEEETKGFLGSVTSSSIQYVKKRKLFWSLLVLVCFLLVVLFSINQEGDSNEEKALVDDDGAEEEEGTKDSPGIDSAPETDSFTLAKFSQVCSEAKAKNYSRSSVEYKVAAANCGWGYDYLNSAGAKKKWKVYLAGPGWTHAIHDLSGCPRTCPNSPKCEIRMAIVHPSKIYDGDVVVYFQTDTSSLVHAFPPNKRKIYQVIYWREAVFSHPSIKEQKTVDFEMGVHYYAGLPNPSFARAPAQLERMSFPPDPPIEFIPVQKRQNFALSIISHCHANSQRDEYVLHLSNQLGSDKVHQYGSCGNRQLPPKPIKNAAKLISTYKFYLSFENTIQDSYVTEKLFYVLNFPILPVYYGALNVPNITIVPSFIKVSDFSSPKALAAYLVFLDSNPNEYMKYHAWRTDPTLYDPEYLEHLQYRVAGPDELLYFKNKKFDRFPRTAQCCRLCDENYVKYAAETRSKYSIVPHSMAPGEIKKRFFNEK